MQRGAFLLLLFLSLRSGAEPGPIPRQIRVDVDGLALPKDALARLGSTRFRHPSPVYHAAFSSDGKELATGAHGFLSVWDASSGRLLRRFEKPDVLFDRIAYSADGKQLFAICAVAGHACIVRTFDSATLGEISEIGIARVHYCRATFKPNADRVAIFSSFPVHVVLLDPSKPKVVVRVAQSNEERPSTDDGYWYNQGFTADGKQLVLKLADPSKPIQVFNSATGKEEEAFIPNASYHPITARPLSSTATIINGSDKVERWDAMKPGPTWQFKSGWAGDSLEISPDGKWVAALGCMQITILDAATGRVAVTTHRVTGTAYRDARDSEHGLTSVAFSPDGRSVAVTSSGGTVGLWDLASGKPLAQSSDPPMAVNYPKFTDRGRRLAVGYGDYSWAEWNLASPSSLIPGLEGIRGFSAVGRIGLRVSPGKPIAYVNLDTGALIRNLETKETWDTWSSGAFSGDGKRLIAQRMRMEGSSGVMNGFEVSDVASGKRIAIYDQHPMASWGTSPNGRLFAISYWDKRRQRLDMWDADASKVRWTREYEQLDSMQFSRDCGSLVHRAHYWCVGPEGVSPRVAPFFSIDVQTGEDVLQADGPPLGILPKLEQDVEREDRLPRPLHRPRIWTLSPDGRMAAVASGDSTILLWELAADQERTRFEHAGLVRGLAFHPAGHTLAATGLADSALLWDVYGTLIEHKKPTAEALRQAWDDLANFDAAKAFQAVRTLIAGETIGLDVLAKRVAGLPVLTTVEVNRLIAELDAKEFRTREQATASLRAVRAELGPRLAAAKKTVGAEGLRRIDNLLESRIRFGADDLRRLRAVEAVEAIGTPEARKLLVEWSRGEGVLGTAAKSAVVRMDCRK